MKKTGIIAASVCVLSVLGMISCGNKTAETSDSATDSVVVVDSAAEQVDSVALAAEAARQDSIAKAEEAARKDSIAKAEEAAKPAADPKIEKSLTKLAQQVKEIEDASNDKERVSSIPMYMFQEAEESVAALEKQESKMTPEQKTRFQKLVKKIRG